MKVTLVIDNKEKTFTVPFVSGRMLRKTLEMTKVLANMRDIDPETLDNLVDYVVELFKGQFTQDEFYDGIEAGLLLKTVKDCLNSVVAGANKATEALQDPNV